MLLRIDADAQGDDLIVAGQPVALRVASVSPHTVRVSLLPKQGAPAAQLEVLRQIGSTCSLRTA